MSNEQKPRDNKQDKGIAGTILHGKIPEWGIKLLEIVLVVASLFLAIRSLFEVIRENISQWSDPTIIASLLVAIISVGLYLDSRFPGESKMAVAKRLLILGAATLACTKLAFSY